MNIEAIKHFERIAARGAHPAASSGEKIANNVAKALHKIGDDLAVLDPDAIEGIRDLIRCMAGPYPTDKFKETTFAIVKRAAGKR